MSFAVHSEGWNTVRSAHTNPKPNIHHKISQVNVSVVMLHFSPTELHQQGGWQGTPGTALFLQAFQSSTPDPPFSSVLCFQSLSSGKQEHPKNSRDFVTILDPKVMQFKQPHVRNRKTSNNQTCRITGWKSSLLPFPSPHAFNLTQDFLHVH